MRLLSLGKGATPVGLDIGSSTFRIAQLKASAEKPILVSYSSTKAPKGLIDEGEITDVDGVAKVLASLWRTAKVTDKRVIVGVANQKVIVRVIEMPAMTETELRSAIKYQVSDYIPIPVEEAILDFQILSEHVNDRLERMMDVLLVAARKDMVENVVAAIERAGLRPVTVDASSLAFARAVTSEKPKSFIGGEAGAEEVTAMINIGSALSDIVVVEDSTPRFTRVSSIGGNTFTEAIANHLGVTFEKAEDLKIKIGLPSQNGKGKLAGVGPDVSEHVEAVHDVLEREMVKFMAEVRRSLDYYLAQASKVESIGKIVVTGGGAKLKNFQSYLKESLKIEVEFGRPLQNVQVSNNLHRAGVEDEEFSLAICIGLAARGLER
ncbi:MAG: type IV pilus assembly protein PilM [Actinobacteria bacterium]|nr:type IV pilus assembly protein PilM [Actinomycetota bacterium]